MAERATMQDVADAAGVSLSTVDRILNRRASVKRATVDHVLAAARRVGYHGVPSIQGWLSDTAPPATFGFLLNSRGRVLYADFAAMLSDRIRSLSQVRGQVVIWHLDTLDPAETIAALKELGESCDAVAIVALDTPEIGLAVEQVIASGTPVFTMFSDLSGARTAFVGSDGTKMGRGAGWLIHRICHAGAIGVVVGSSGYLAHRAYRDGFVDFMRNREREILMAGETLENDETAEHLVSALLVQRPDIAAIFVAGGGLGGAIAAVANAGRTDIVVIGTELSREVDRALEAGVIDAVLSHPAETVADQIVLLMEAAVIAGGHAHCSDLIVPVDIKIRETI